jgi:hypothetical protein
MKTNKQYDVLSPDGFSIHFSDTYNSINEAKSKLTEWTKRYEHQGFYSSNNGRISLSELEQHCQIVEIDAFIETM